MTPQDWFCVGIALGVALVSTPLVRVVARRVGMIARPRADRWHTKPTALMGGVAVFAGLLSASLSQGIPWAERRWLYLGGVFMFGLGFVDDIWRIKPGQKLLGQIIAATFLLVLGPLLPWTPIAFLNALITFVWIIGITNAINLLDNMDGLATGVSLIAAAFLSFVLWQNGEAEWAVLSAALAASLAGFLVFNSNPASIFLGDCGALFIGYVIAAISIQAASTVQTDCVGTPVAIPVLILLVPIFDTTFVTLLRKLAGRPASQGGRDHTSHRLVALAWSERQAVWILYGLALASGGMALLVMRATAEVALPAVFLFLAAVIFLGIHLAGVIIYPEEEFQLARQKKFWIACWWQAVEWRLLDRILDSCLILLVWQWDCKLAIDTSTASEHLFLMGATMVLIKAACLSVLGVYRVSWLSPRAGQWVRLAQAVTLGEIASIWIWIFLAKAGWASAVVSLFDGAVLMILLLGMRLAFGTLRALLRLNQV